MNGFRRIGRGIKTSALAAVGAAVLIAGCGGSSSGGSGQTSAAALKRAAYVSSAASGFRAAMTIQMTFGQGSSQKSVDMSARGSFSPGSHTADMTMHMQLPTGAPTSSLDMRMVLDKGTMYMKLPASLASRIPSAKPWLSMNLAQLGKAAGIPGYGSLLNSSSNFSDPGQYLDFLRATADGSVKEVGQETVDGTQTTHYQAQVDIAKLANAVPSADKNAVQQLVSMLTSKGINTQMPIDAWIDNSHRIRRLHITYGMTVNGQSLAMDITENLTDYGAQPSPTVPSADQTTNLLSLMHGSLTQNG